MYNALEFVNHAKGFIFLVVIFSIIIITCALGYLFEVSMDECDSDI